MIQPWKSSIITSSVVILLDQLTKWWAVESLTNGEIVELIWTLQFRLVRNTGIAFSQGEGLGPLFTVLIFFVIFLVIRWSAQLHSKSIKVATGLIVGGAVGNLIDRVFRTEDGFLNGGVVDFVDLQWWPVFNVADAAIVVGGFMMFLAGMKSAKPEKENFDSNTEAIIQTSNESIPDPLDGERLDRVVAFIFDISRNHAGNLIDAGKVALDGEVEQSRSRRVHLGENLNVSKEEQEEKDGPEPEKSIKVPIVHEDNEVLVVNKPAGLVVHPGAGNMTGTMVNGLLASWPDLRAVGEKSRPGIVHRLDRGTSGLLVVARTQEAYVHLSAQLSDRSMGRWYTALVWGQMDSDTGSVDAPIGRSKRDRIRMAVISAGRQARTNYEVVQRWTSPDVSLIRCKLETGRTHQIRVHLSAIGHPLVGDELYGGKRSEITLERPFLHASFLEFDHPKKDERIAFESALPDDLEKILDSLSD